MAFAVGDSVLLTLSPGFVAAHGDRYPNVGRVSDDAGPIDVVWADGTLASVTSATAIDRLIAATDASLNLLIGSYVQRPGVPNPGQRLSGIVVAVFGRDSNGGGISITDQVVVRTAQGLYFEFPAADAVVSPSR